MTDLTIRDQLDLVTEIIRLFDDPDISVGISTPKGIHDYMTVKIETAGRPPSVEVRVNEMIESVNNGECTLKDVARTIIKLYEAVYPYPRCRGNVLVMT